MHVDGTIDAGSHRTSADLKGPLPYATVEREYQHINTRLDKLRPEQHECHMTEYLTIHVLL